MIPSTPQIASPTPNVGMSIPSFSSTPSVNQGASIKSLTTNMGIKTPVSNRSSILPSIIGSVK